MDHDARVIDLNVLLATYLKSARRSARTIDDVAAEKLGPIDADYQSWLVDTVSAARRQIIAYVRAEFDKGRWDRHRDRAAHEWVASQYPWMTKKNRSRAIGLGWYYAIF